jgi:hypothetical protein
MSKLNEIREQLANYLAGEISRPEFEDWFVQSSWNIHQSDEPDAKNLVHCIELRLAEFSSGHLTEQGLRKELLPFVTSINTSIVFDNATINTPMGLDVKWLEVGAILFGDPENIKSSVEFELALLRQ